MTLPSTRYISVLLLIAAAAAGCRFGTETKEAVRQAVVDDLKGRSGIDLTKTTVRVVKVVFMGNRAEADVAFRSNGRESTGLDVHYSLSRKGNGWKVDARQPFPGRSGGRPGQSGDDIDLGPTPPGSVSHP